MRFLVILLCLGLEKFFTIGIELRRFQFLDFYLSSVEGSLKKADLWHGTIAIILLCGAPVLLLGLIYWMTYNFMFGLLWLIISAIVLLMTFRTPASSSHSRTLRTELWNTYEDSFSVLFWFIILGPFGALFYRLLSMLHLEITHHKGSEGDLPAGQWLKIMDWFAIRFLALSYVIVGDAPPTLARFFGSLKEGTKENKKSLVDCGVIALQLDEQAAASSSEENLTAVKDLNDRALVVWVIIVALISLGHLFGAHG